MKRLGILLTIFGCVCGALESTIAMFDSHGMGIYPFALSGFAFMAGLGFVLYQMGKDLDKGKP